MIEETMDILYRYYEGRGYTTEETIFRSYKMSAEEIPQREYDGDLFDDGLTDFFFRCEFNLDSIHTDPLNYGF